MINSIDKKSNYLEIIELKPYCVCQMDYLPFGIHKNYIMDTLYIMEMGMLLDMLFGIMECPKMYDMILQNNGEMHMNMEQVIIQK